MGSGAALAASTHPYATTFPTGPNCNPREVATDASGYVYVMCEGTGLNHKMGSLRKFDSNGNPVDWEASAFYISGNEINENPANQSTGFYGKYEWGTRTYLAIDRSSAHPGYIYVADYDGPTWGSRNIDIFAPSGEYVTSIKFKLGEGQVSGVGVDQNGYVYAIYEGSAEAHISKYTPNGWKEIERILPIREGSSYYGACCTRISPDTTGSVWAGWGLTYFDGGNRIGKYEANQFNTNLRTGYGLNEGAVVGHTSPFLIEAFPPGTCPELQESRFGGQACALEGYGFDVDLSNNDLYVDSGKQIVPYSQGTAESPVHQDGPAFGGEHLEAPQGVNVDNAGNVYVTAEPNKVVKFTRGGTLPTVTTKAASIADIGHTSATVRGIVDPAGGGEIMECRFKFGETTQYTGASSPATCNEATPWGGGATEVSATLTGLTVGQTYHYRLGASNASGNDEFGGDRTFEAKAVLKLVTKPAEEVNEHEAILQGELDADGMATTYYFEYGPNASYGLKTGNIEINGAPGVMLTTPTKLVHLQTGHTYHYRLVASNSLGTTKGQDQAFRTASPPEISGVGDENVTDTTADLHATINPVGYDTTYEFEYGTTPAYGQSLPASGNDLGSGTSPQEVNVHLSGLPVGSTIHYRVVATNKWGTSSTDDTTFNFRPPACPNAHVRALTGAGYLPDCRAYELVSPGYAGAVDLLPSEAYTRFGEFAEAPQNFGYASNPSRFVYAGGDGSINGLDAPNSLFDVYLATRTNTGWVTTLPGLKGNETLFTYGRACSDSQDLCVDHIGPHWEKGEEGLEEVPASEAPYLYRADGARLDRLPTNVGVIKGGTKFVGDEQLSGDYRHFVFSTQTPFVPPPEGITTAPGSVYDNNIPAKTVSVISKLPNGDPLPLEPTVASDSTHVNGIAGVSTDGSRVLMAGTTQPHCGSYGYESCPYILSYPAVLYMRVNDSVTHEVSRGKEVNFVGMTRDGSKVYFTTTEQLLPADQDTSRDLYMWQEEGDKLTLVSQEGSLGNDDTCSATWTVKCGVEPLTPEKMVGSLSFRFIAHVQGIDDVMANESGDIYFYSPEDLAAGEIGGDGQRNLYLYRNGHLHLVTTFEPGTQVERSTISQDGSHAAFMTKSSLTAYNSEHHREVYTYNADTGALRCASCNPAGTPPMSGEATVTVSESGPFMANDGRTFFATKESLVPQDTDGIRDVYEYVNGHAQLVSSGTGNRDNTGGLELLSFFFPTLQTGLESVSRDGVDVYFSTFETLTPEDKNGSFLKFYDARNGGGFDFIPELGRCAAADECHGEGISPPTSLQIGTNSSLGKTGNLPVPGKKKRRKRSKRRHRHAKPYRKAHGGHRNG